MSGSLGIGNSNAATDPVLDGYRVQTSIFGSGIPILLGTCRVSGNVTQIWNWQSSSSQGKSGIGKNKGSSSFNYTASFIISYCQGNILGTSGFTILAGWVDKNQITGVNPFAFGSSGAYGQAPWAGGQYQLAYSEEFYLGFTNTSLGTAGNISNYSWELKSPFTFLPLAWLDALCTDAIYAVLRDFHMMNFPDSQIGDMTESISYCLAYQIGVSPVINAQDTAQTILQELLLVCNSEIYSSGGFIKIGCWGDTTKTQNYSPAGGWGSGATGTVNLDVNEVASVTITSGGSYLAPPTVTFSGGSGSGATGVALLGNGLGMKPVVGVQIITPGSYTAAPSITFTPATNATFTPDLTPIYALDNDAFIVGDKSQDPITFSLDPIQDASNTVYYEWTNRGRQYNLETISDSDDDAINKYGQTIGTVQTIHSVTEAIVASQVASVQLKRGIYYLRKAQFTLGWAYSLLEPMDIVTVPEQYPSTSVVGVRITSIEEDESGNLAIEGTVLPYPICNPAIYAKQTSGGYTPGLTALPTETIAPIFFELPPELAQTYTTTQLVLSISLAGGTGWGGVNVYLSTTGESGPYMLVGIQKLASVMGFLTAAYAFGADPDTVNLLQVNVQPSNGVIDPGSSSLTSANNFTTLALIDQEVISYAYVTMTGDSEYSFENATPLIYNRRGVFNSYETAHASGAPFSVIGDGNQFIYEYSPQDIGTTLWFKFQAFNEGGQNLQDLTSVTAYPWTLTAPFVRGPLAVKPYGDIYIFAPNGYSPHLAQINGSSGVAGGSIQISVTPPANALSTTVVAPIISPTGTVTATGGTLLLGTYYAQVFAVDASGNYSSGSNLTEWTTANGTSKVQFSVTFGSSVVGYEVFVGTDLDHLVGQGQQTGAPTSITLTFQSEEGYGPPDPRAAIWHARAKRVIHGGIFSTNVETSSLAAIEIYIPSAATSDEFAGRYLIAVSKYGLPQTQSWSVIPILHNDTGTPYCTLTVVSGTGTLVGPGDLVLVSMQVTSATSTTTTDSGLVSPYAPTGLYPSVVSASWSGGVATLTLSSINGIISGNTYTVAGINPSGYNGSVVLTVVDNIHVTYPLVSNPGSYVSGGSVATNAEANQILRVIYDPTGSAQVGSEVTILSNTETTFTHTPWASIPGVGAVLIEEEAAWRVDQTTTENTNYIQPNIVAPSLQPVINIDSTPLQGYLALVELLSQDIDGNDSEEIGNGFRMLYITPGSVLPKPTVVVSTTTTLQPVAQSVVANAGSGAFTITLPPFSLWAGQDIIIQKNDSSTNAVTWQLSSGDSIPGTGSSGTLTTQGATIKITAVLP